MAERRVTRTGKDSDGDITMLCSFESWASVTKAIAIQHIENRSHSYYVHEEFYRSDVHVVTVGFSKHLRTDADKSSKNNLDNLPPC